MGYRQKQSLTIKEFDNNRLTVSYRKNIKQDRDKGWERHLCDGRRRVGEIAP